MISPSDRQSHHEQQPPSESSRVAFPSFTSDLKMSCLIAVETATKWGGVSVAKDGIILQTIRFTPDTPASEKLIPSIQTLLAQNHLTPDIVDAYAVSIGPGSFTGLRVGLTAVKTLAYFSERPVITIPSLDVLASQSVKSMMGSGAYLATLMDATKGDVFGAVYEVSHRLHLQGNYQAASVEQILGPYRNREVWITGDALLKYRERILDFSPGFHIMPSADWHPNPEAVVTLALSGNYPQMTGTELYSLSPLYIRRSEAEIQWEKKYGSA